LEITRPVGKSLIAGQVAVRAVSSQYLRGNDANLDQVNVSEEGAPRFVSGVVPGYAVTNLRLRYERRHVAINADVSNIFDRQYETFGIFGENPAGPIGGPRPSEPMIERFLNPGYPRSLTISLEAKP
jgi:outer membrane receptor protein involved in Fe transport